MCVLIKGLAIRQEISNNKADRSVIDERIFMTLYEILTSCSGNPACGHFTSLVVIQSVSQPICIKWSVGRETKNRMAGKLSQSVGPEVDGCKR